MEWSEETGIGGEFYAPDSFNLLNVGGQRAAMYGNYSLDVTLRATVIYKKNLRAKVPLVVPTPPELRSAWQTRHEIELVVLAILKVQRISYAEQNE